MMAGPRMTMNSDGKMQPTSGNSILIGALAACSSARWRRSMRSCSDWTWRTLEIETPSCSAWMIAPMKLVSGATSVRGTMSRSASRRALPTRTSASARRNSSDSGPCSFSTTLAERGVEAETGADGDRQQVERVRDHQQDRLLALLAPAGPARTPGRCSRRGADRGHQEADEERQADDADDDEQEEEEDRADDRADRLDAEPVGDAQVARVAGQRQALLRAVAEGRARDPLARCRTTGPRAGAGSVR